MLLIPLAVSVVIDGLLLCRQLMERPHGAMLHHVMAAVPVTVRQALYKSIAGGQICQQLGGILPPRDSFGHFDGKHIGQAQHG